MHSTNGRPTALSPDVQHRIIQALKLGNYSKHQVGDGRSTQIIGQVHSECLGDDVFAGDFVGLHGAHPAPKAVPNVAGEVDGEVDEQSLSHACERGVAVVGVHLALDVLAVEG